MIEDGNKISGGLHKIARFFGIIGIILEVHIINIQF